AELGEARNVRIVDQNQMTDGVPPVVVRLGRDGSLESIQRSARHALAAGMHMDVEARGLGIYNHPRHLFLRERRLADRIRLVGIGLEQESGVSFGCSVTDYLQYAHLHQFRAEA